MRLPITLAATLLCLAPMTRGQSLDLLPAYEPGPAISGKLVAWGNPEQKGVWDAWVKGFRKYHPNVVCESTLKSSATIAGALFTGAANIGVGGRELMPVEALAYRNIFDRDVFRVVTSSGTYDVGQSTPALGIFVPASNPLRHLTLAQADGIFGDEHRRAGANIRTWDQLGLTGAWAGKPIHVYGHAVNMPANALFFAGRVFNGGTRWNREMQEFGELRSDGVKSPASGAQIIQAIAKDPYGIGYTSFDNRTAGVKSLALGQADGGPFIAPSRETVASRAYPLTRNTYVYVNRDPSQGFDPVVKEFLRYVLSREGQQAVADNNYLPLTAEELRAQLERIE